MKQIQCQNCQSYFDAVAIIDGKRKELYARSYCLICAPYGHAGRKQLQKYKLIDGVEYKQCSKCNEFKSVIDCFYCTKSNDGKLYPGSHCKTCLTIRGKESGRTIKLEAVQYKGGKCHDCKQSYPLSVYDFHHREPEHKDFEIASFQGFVKERYWPKLKIELDKCDLLCANCHRIRHASLE